MINSGSARPIMSVTQQIAIYTDVTDLHLHKHAVLNQNFHELLIKAEQIITESGIK